MNRVEPFYYCFTYDFLRNPSFWIMLLFCWKEIKVLFQDQLATSLNGWFGQRHWQRNIKIKWISQLRNVDNVKCKGKFSLARTSHALSFILYIYLTYFYMIVWLALNAWMHEKCLFDLKLLSSVTIQTTQAPDNDCMLHIMLLMWGEINRFLAK